MDINVAVSDKKLEFRLMGFKNSLIFDGTLQNLTRDIFVYMEENSAASVAYGCQDGCWFYSTPDSSEPMELIRGLQSSSTFYIYRRQSFKELTFIETYNTCIGIDLPHTNKTRSVKDLTNGWNALQVDITNDNYEILVDGHEVLNVNEPFMCYKLLKIDVFLEGKAYWSLDCDPFDVAKHVTSTKSSGIPMATTAYDKSPSYDSTVYWSLEFEPSYEHALPIFLCGVLAVDALVLVGSIINLMLTLQLLRR